MSGETEASPSAWTIDSTRALLQTRIDNLEKHLDERADAQQRAVDAALVAHQEALRAASLSQDRALSVALASLEKRLDAMNEFRAQLRDQGATFMPRTESLALHSATGEKIDALTGRLSDIELRVTARLEATSGGQQAAQRVITFAIAGAGLVMTIVVFVANYIFK